MTAHGERLNRIVAAQAERQLELQACREEGGDYRFVTKFVGPEIDAAHKAVEVADYLYADSFINEGPQIVQSIRNNLPGVRRQRRNILANKRRALYTIRSGVRSVEGNQELYWQEIASGLHD